MITQWVVAAAAEPQQQHYGKATVAAAAAQDLWLLAQSMASQILIAAGPESQQKFPDHLEMKPPQLSSGCLGTFFFFFSLQILASPLMFVM